MKKIILVLLLTLSLKASRAQEQELQQLLLNLEKLAQLKGMLQDMYNGWQVVQQGYQKIKMVASGQFRLHETFLDGLLAVSPAVRHYYKVKEIVSLQVSLVTHYKEAFRQFRTDGSFTPAEIRHMATVSATLFTESLRVLDALTRVLTAGALRMTDAERLEQIDQLHAQVRNQFAFLYDFTSSTKQLALQRKSEQAQLELMRRLHGR